jgi:hypothetical protein
MAKIFIRNIRPYVDLYQDRKTGIAWIEDGTAGVGISCHPNISDTGSIRGMRAKGWWDKKDRIVRSRGFYYNIDHLSGSGADYEIVRKTCDCGGYHGEGRAMGGGKRRHGVAPYAVHVWEPGSEVSHVTSRHGSKGKAVKMAQRQVARQGKTARVYDDVGRLKRLWASDVGPAGGKRRHSGAGDDRPLGRGGMYWVAQVVRGREEDAMTDRQIRDLIREAYERAMGVSPVAFSLKAALKYGLKLHHTRTLPSDVTESAAFMKKEASEINKLLRK